MIFTTNIFFSRNKQEYTNKVYIFVFTKNKDMKTNYLWSLLLLGLFTNCQKSENKIPLTIIVGTYTDSPEQGISIYHFDEKTADATLISTTPMVNPSYLSLSADNKYLYAVSELDSADASVSSFHFDTNSGTLKLINSKPTYGASPCYINNDDTRIYVANYGGGSLCYYEKDSQKGLGELIDVINFNDVPNDTIHPAHAHCVYFSPDSTQVFINNLGKDSIHCFERTEDGKLTPSKQSTVPLTAGYGPRHSIFSPNKKQMYLINELSGMLDVFNYKDKTLTHLQSIACDSVGGHGSADIHISNDGRFVYASNRLKADGISIYSIQQDGKLVKIAYQKTGIHPRNFALTPNNNYLLVACRDDNQIEIYRRNNKTGLLSDTNKRIKLNKPVYIKCVH